MKKNYSHFSNTARADFAVTAVGGIDWIEKLLNSSEGIIDCRKRTIDLVMAPYLVTIKQYDYDTAYSRIAEWLDRCGKRRRLDFDPRNKVPYSLRRSLKSGIKPMKLETMKNSYHDMYKELVTNKYRITR